MSDKPSPDVVPVLGSVRNAPEVSALPDAEAGLTACPPCWCARGQPASPVRGRSQTWHRCRAAVLLLLLSENESIASSNRSVRRLQVHHPIFIYQQWSLAACRGAVCRALVPRVVTFDAVERCLCCRGGGPSGCYLFVSVCGPRESKTWL